MSKNKWTALILLLPVFLFFSEPATVKAVGYKTATLTVGDLQKEVSLSAGMYFPHWEEVVYESEYGPTTFVTYLVMRGDFVEEGDPILEIYTEVSDLEIEEMELKVKRAEEALQEQMDAGALAVHEVVRQKGIHSAGNDANTMRYYDLEIEATQMRMDRANNQKAEALEDLREQLKIMKDAKERTVIYAPVSGYVDSLKKLSAGGTIKKGAVIATIYELKDVLFTMDDMSGVLAFGMDVTLESSSGNFYPAKVVSSVDRSLSDGIRGSVSYIKATEEIPIEEWWGMILHYNAMDLKNVIALESGWYSTDSTGTYVLEVTDNGIMRHYFTPGAKTGSKLVAVDGLYEGMTIVIE